uniref:Uncharacterized protein n=1 Tax=Elphidium margaritaceum TaxID=933848 RepID=A0A7S0XNC4_9EUKA
MQFTPVCRTAADVGSDLASYCDTWLNAHQDIAAGVGLTATLQWRDEECDPLLFEVQFQAEMLFYVDDAFTEPVASDTLYQVGEDRIYVEVDTAFPSDTYDVFDTQLLNVWVCTFDPLNGPTLPIEAGELSGGCFSTNIDGYNGAENYEEDNMYAYHIFDAVNTVSVPELIDFQLVGHPTALDADKDKLRFSFVVPEQVARDTLYIHAQIEVSLTGARRRRQLLSGMAVANQMSHFLGNIGVSNNPQPRLPAPQQPQQPWSNVPSGDNGVYLLSLRSPWIMAIAGLLAVILTFNVGFWCYMRCCDDTRRGRVAYKKVKVQDSEFDESEANVMNVVSE